MSRSFRTDPKTIRAARRTGAAKAELRIVEQSPRKGYFHPATAAEIRNFIRKLGPVASYGLKEIVLARVRAGQSFRFGHYEAPNRISLFEQPIGDWQIPGVLDEEIRINLEAAGARVTMNATPAVATIHWPGKSLRKFMLENVLLHEIGHHVLHITAANALLASPARAITRPSPASLSNAAKAQGGQLELANRPGWRRNRESCERSHHDACGRNVPRELPFS